MDALVVTKANKLSGKIKLKGAKNSILPIIAACVLTSDEVLIRDCPKLSDISDMLGIMQSIGAKVQVNGDDITICCRQINPHTIDRGLMSKIRSSIFILGPLLARCGEANIFMPGGCEIGKRPIDLHLDGLRKLGVVVDEECAEENCGIVCKGTPKGGIVTLKYPSVGATENLMMAGALSNGQTTIYGCAKEPEIVDLAAFLNTIGARVYGAGSNLIVIDGKRCLHGARYKPITDRIAAGTYMAAAAVSGGDIYIEGAIGDHMDATVYKFRAAGAHIIEEQRGIRVYCDNRLKAIKQTVTLPYPGFPTDMQPILVAALATAKGKSVVTETLFENRFRFAYQLERMGADIVLDGDNTAIIKGQRLHGADVYAQDLRGGAALTVAALAADGITLINGVEHIDRGYESLENELNSLGANISRINKTD
ncbi:MAG: UDP-N-acetylglucosamine 1-carboxyvinyltransferase [Clostridiales bacterium]|nr:UDP-N-acetylglucosamine 1-carboxyvinyltransferase [Clostridiales bacterium]